MPAKAPAGRAERVAAGIEAAAQAAQEKWGEAINKIKNGLRIQSISIPIMWLAMCSATGITRILSSRLPTIAMNGGKDVLQNVRAISLRL